MFTSNLIAFTSNLIAFTFASNLSYTVLLTTSLLTTSLSLLKSTGTVLNLSTCILSTTAFNLAKLDLMLHYMYQFLLLFLKSIFAA